LKAEQAEHALDKYKLEMKEKEFHFNNDQKIQQKLEGEIVRLQEKLLDKIEEVEALQRELTQLEGAALDVGDHELILQLEEQIKALEHEVEHQKKKAKNYELKDQLHVDQIQEMEVQLKDGKKLQAELTKLKKKLHEKEKKMKKMEKDLKKAKHGLKDAKAEHEELEKCKRDLDQMTENYNKEKIAHEHDLDHLHQTEELLAQDQKMIEALKHEVEEEQRKHSEFS